MQDIFTPRIIGLVCGILCSGMTAMGLSRSPIKTPPILGMMLLGCCCSSSSTGTLINDLRKKLA